MTQQPKVLISNRGEIACRIISACRKHGYRSVAVYSDADAEALHVEMADEAVAIGPAPARESYLNAERILDAARDTDAQAIHPGYGFLSEQPLFASAVENAGLRWVGPTAQSIHAMGNKDRARVIARAAGVPVLPGSALIAPDAPDLTTQAERIGYPLLIKAASGGGGIGMRLVESATSLEEAAAATASMAQKAFGDPSIYLERYVAHARHIEVQVFGFGDGTGVHLFERDCSIQRRYQKIIEEAGDLEVDPAALRQMREAAMALVAAQSYRGAGTIEYLYDVERNEAYFLEMNTRIQVEHPVTEMITGRDLVGMQLALAFDVLPAVSQTDIISKGHAIEVRIYAERPEKGFLPSPGSLEQIDWPQDRDWLRIDTGVRSGDKITPFYDPMIAKVIVSGANRKQAIERMRTVLGETDLGSARTNLAFLRDLVQDEALASGPVTTGFLPKWLNAWLEVKSTSVC